MRTEKLSTIDSRLTEQNTDGSSAANLSNAGGGAGGGISATTSAADPGGPTR
jgi:hypothetical protein